MRVRGNTILGTDNKLPYQAPTDSFLGFVPYDPRTEHYDFLRYDYGRDGRGYDFVGLGIHKKIKKQWNRVRKEIERSGTKVSQAIVPKKIRKEVGRFYKRRGKKFLKLNWAITAGIILPWGKAKWMGVDKKRLKYFKGAQKVGRVAVIALTAYYAGPAIISGMKTAGASIMKAGTAVKGKILSAFATEGTKMTAAQSAMAKTWGTKFVTGTAAKSTLFGKAAWVGSKLAKIGPAAATMLLNQGLSPMSASPEEVMAATVESGEAQTYEIERLRQLGLQKKVKRKQNNTAVLAGAVGIAAIVMAKGD